MRGRKPKVSTRGPLRGTKGMSLLEVTIALLVLAIGMLGLAGLQLVALRGDTLGQQANLAATLAKDKLAELEEIDQLSEGKDQYVDEENGITYTMHWVVQSDIPQEDMTTVKVQVSWQGPMVDRCVTVSTVIKRS